MTATTEEIIEIVKKRAKPAATVTETSHLYEDLWISTSDFEEIAYEIQERFGESLSVEDFRSGKISSVGDIVDHLKAQDWGSRSFHQQFDDEDDVPATNSEEEALPYEKPLSYILFIIVILLITYSGMGFIEMMIAALIAGYAIKAILKIARIIWKIVKRNKN